MVTKYIFVTGGVVSSLGKGIIAASLGKLMRARGFTVTVQKFDPYINVDPGTMSPFQHGEVFVTDDGAETDLDLGHYERFIDTNLGRINNVTSGRVYLNVITKERRGEYLGGTVQIIPHITDEIKQKLHEATSTHKPDIQICEIGGTVGDIEGLAFLEAIRQFRNDVGFRNAVNIHVTLVPYISAAGELKTKPTQHSVNTLRSIGIQPDILVCRTERTISKSQREKISQFTNVPFESVIQCQDMESIYEVPLAIENEGLAREVLTRLDLTDLPPDLEKWKEVVNRLKYPGKTIRVVVAGKYTKLSDAYISVVEAIKHAGAAIGRGIDLKWISSDDCLTYDKAHEELNDVDAVIVPGGFGYRGIEGKINIIKYVRENNIPFLGLCLGMQCAVIEYARHKANFNDANSSEFEPDTPHPVVALMAEQEDIVDYGGTMRLGQYPCKLNPDSKSRLLYGTEIIYERHRHRYEINNKYREKLQESGMLIAGTSPDGNLVELIELPEHKYFVASQYHPEFKSRPERPHPLFVGLVSAAASKDLARVIEDINADETYKPSDFHTTITTG
ncbi:MAG: CTP synthase [Cyanobacteriota bacterium]